jgi:hypothetical protein
MALSQSDLKNDLIDLFNEMEQSPMNRTDYADKWSALLVKHIKTAAIPAGSVIVDVVGQATGKPNTSEITVE